MDTALIDSDILIYRVGFTTETESEGIAQYRMNEYINEIMAGCACRTARHYLTSDDKSNFRFKLFPEYKAHRKDKPKPKHYDFLREHLVYFHKAEVIYGQEADDQLGIIQMSEPRTVICSIDKDLDQIPGWHYNFVNLRRYNISPIEAQRSFYEQCLVGDKSTDNIEGCPGIGKVKANRMLEGCQDETEMLQRVVSSYQRAYGEEYAERLLLAGNLLWIRKKPNQAWELLSGEVVSKITLDNALKDWESTLTMKPERFNISSLSA